jgi:hypothetical protein
MAWCASFQLKSFRDCQCRFYYLILPRCSFCPPFDAERAIRDVLGENPPPGTVQKARVWHRLRRRRADSKLTATMATMQCLVAGSE